MRCGARVLMELGSFPAPDFESLFQGVLSLPWEAFIPRDGEFPVKGYSLNSQLHSVPACQSIVKKASAKRLGEKYGMETLPESGSRYQIQFSIIKDVATLYLDTSGEGLYKRGYRAKNMGAPLRETLAAALVTLSRYRGKDPFCDPFCGSGTIPIEAALIAKNRAPGLDRSFAAQKWKNMDSKLWLEAGDEAMDKEFHGHYDIWGGDIDPAAVELARHNAELVAELEAARSAALEAARAREQAFQTRLNEATHEHHQTLARVRAQAHAARAELGRLRDDLAAPFGLSNLAGPAGGLKPDPARALLGDCASAYLDLAEQADGHAADVRLLLDGWPR